MVRIGKRRIKASSNASEATHLARMAVEPRPIASLKPNPRNARTHSKKQIRQIADSIVACGFTAPVVCTENLNPDVVVM